MISCYQLRYKTSVTELVKHNFSFLFMLYLFIETMNKDEPRHYDEVHVARTTTAMS